MEPPGRFFQPSQYEPNLPAPPPLMTHPCAKVQQDCEAVVEESLATAKTALKQAEGRVANLLVVEQRATTLLPEKQVVEESLATAETALKQAEGRVAHLTLENAQVRDAVLNIQNQLPTVKTSKRDRDSDQDRELAAINRTSRTGWHPPRNSTAAPASVSSSCTSASQPPTTGKSNTSQHQPNKSSSSRTSAK
jgi:exonuclease VII small subunit